MIERTLNLSPNILPPLENGKYRVEVTQDTNIKDCKLESAALDFMVKTDRIAMSTGEVYSVYPPRESIGAFSNCLPHIVLHRRTLPWEHVVKESGAPWLALLVVSEDEVAEPSTMKYGESKTFPADMLCPDLKGADEPDLDEICQTVTIPYNLFADILPTGADLPFLAHARGVNLDNKVTDIEVKGEWFSCIIANRFPVTPNDKNSLVKHTAYLVSLEGFGDYIYDEDIRRDGADIFQNVRFYAMYSWSFQTKSAGDYDFYSLAGRLTTDTLLARYMTGDTSVNKLLQLGYVPVNHHFREGSRSISWYHSPFTPGQPKWNDCVKAHFLSDELLEYDPQNGMFDISHSAAWQLGRLMALADKDFSRKLLSWRLSKKSEGTGRQMYRIIAQKMAFCKTLLSKASQSDNGAVESQKEALAYQDENTADLCRKVWRSGVVQLMDICGKRPKSQEPVSVKNLKDLEERIHSRSEIVMNDGSKHRLKPITQEDILSLFEV